MCCKQLIKTDTQISLSVLNNIASEISKARLRLHKVEDKENMHFLIRSIRYILHLRGQERTEIHRRLRIYTGRCIIIPREML